MACEFINRVRTFKHGIILERFDLLSPQSKKAFNAEISELAKMDVDDLPGLYSRITAAARTEGAAIPEWKG